MTPRTWPAELASLLSSSGSESKSWLLELARRQAARKRPADLVAQYQRDGLVRPSQLDQRLTLRLDGLALQAAAEYEALLLSPLAPLGCCSVVAPTSQDRTVSSMRGSEVVSDPTNLLALECAERLRRAPDSQPRLCTVHQTVRAQPLTGSAGHSQHFRLFALVDAGRGRPDDEFEVSALSAQLGVFDRLFDLGQAALGCRFPRRRVLLRLTAERRVLGERLSARIAQSLPHVEVGTAAPEASYYAGVRVSFGADTPAGEYCAIGDLGVFDWLTQLNSDRRMRFVASGFGLQLMPLLFAGPDSR